MKVYSAQEKKFIEAKNYASSEFRPQDNRTCQGYYIDVNGLIHSDDLNYSLLFTKAVTIEEFQKRVDESENYYKITIYELAQ